MPYDKASPKDRERVVRHLARSRPRVPRRAVDTFIAIFNRVYDSTRDESRAFAIATGVVNRRFPPAQGSGHAALGVAALAPAARMLGMALGRKALQEIELTLQNCDCGRDHARTLQALQLAISTASRAAGNPAPEAALGLAAFRHGGHAASGAEVFSEARQVGANVAIVWKVFARDIYANGDKVFLAVREMLQNSRDARAKNVQIQWIPDNADDPESDGTLVFEDDGRGMDQRTVEERFLVIGESGEEKRSGSEDQLGGFGAAKAAILTASRDGWSWELRTRNVIARSAAAGMYQVATAADFLQGTRITLPGVQGGRTSTPIGSGTPEQRIAQLISTCDLRGIRVTVNGKVYEGYFEGRRARHGETERGFELSRWGAFTPTIRSYARPDKKGGAIIVRVKGLAQFAKAAPYGAHFERDWVLDFEIPKGVTPHMEDYPFKAGRDAFRVGAPAYYAFERMRDALVVTAASGSPDLGEYEEVAPDASDPREQRAQAQFNNMLDDVFGSDSFSDVLADLAESSEEMTNAIREALATPETAPGVVNPEDVSVRPGSRPEAPPSTLTSRLVSSLLSGSFTEQITQVEAFVVAQLPDGDLSGFTFCLGRLRSSRGDAFDLEVVAKVVQDAMTRAAPGESALVIGAAVARILRVLETGIPADQQDEVKQKKRKGDINPFGNAACIFIHRERFGEEAGKEFRRKAKRYMRHLVAWDFTVRSVLTAANASPANTWPRIEQIGVGFVLDPEVLGLCRKDGRFVMVNPLALEKVADTYKDRAFVVAAWLHGVACHEIAHAMYIRGQNGSAAHNTDWSIIRENLANDTLFLLPAIEEGVARVLKLKRRRARRPQAPGTDDARIAALEASLAEAKAAVDEYRSMEAHRTRMIPRYSEFAHRLEHLIGLYEFREWIRRNPGAAAAHGVSVEDVIRALDAPDSGTRVIALLDAMDQAEKEQHSALFRRAGRRYVLEATEARHAACGCLGLSADVLTEDRVETAGAYGAALRRAKPPPLFPPTGKIHPAG